MRRVSRCGRAERDAGRVGDRDLCRLSLRGRAIAWQERRCRDHVAAAVGAYVEAEGPSAAAAAARTGSDLVLRVASDSPYPTDGAALAADAGGVGAVRDHCVGAGACAARAESGNLNLGGKAGMPTHGYLERHSDGHGSRSTGSTGDTGQYFGRKRMTWCG